MECKGKGKGKATLSARVYHADTGEWQDLGVIKTWQLRPVVHSSVLGNLVKAGLCAGLTWLVERFRRLK